MTEQEREALPPLPEPTGVVEIDCGAAPGGGREIMFTDGYSADQMHAYARAALAATPAPALYVGLIERLMRLSTRLGIANEGGIEHFAASLEDRLYAICRGAESLLDSMAATPATAPASVAEPVGHFIEDFGGEKGRWQQCKEAAQYTVPLFSEPVQAHAVAHAALAATPAPAPEATPHTEFVLNELRSSLNAMLTFFGMDEDESSKEVFDKARQAYNYAQIVMRPLEPWERQSLKDLRDCVGRWHEKAVAKGYDGVESMCDTAPAPEASPAQAQQAEPVALPPIARRRVFDAIAGAYDLGYADRKAGRIGAAKEVEIDHGGALIAALERALAATPAPAPQAEAWCVSYDEERFWGDLPSREAAIAELEGRGGWIAKVANPKDLVSAYHIGESAFEAVSEALGDTVGEVAEAFKLTKDERTALGRVVLDWIDRGPGFRCFGVREVECIEAGQGKEASK